MAKGSVRQVREVLTRAAERVDTGLNHRCCWAISDAHHDDGIASYDSHDAAGWYLCELYSPFLNKKGAAEFWNMPNTSTRQRLRVLALLFAAASYEGP